MVLVVVVSPADVVVVVSPADVVVVDVERSQGGVEMTLLSSVTAPVLARRRPLIVAPVRTAMDVEAMMVPTKLVVVSTVADEPTCQKTLQPWAPFSRTMELAGAVVRLDPAWKIKTASL